MRTWSSPPAPGLVSLLQGFRRLSNHCKIAGRQLQTMNNIWNNPCDSVSIISLNCSLRQLKKSFRVWLSYVIFIFENVFHCLADWFFSQFVWPSSCLCKSLYKNGVTLTLGDALSCSSLGPCNVKSHCLVCSLYSTLCSA